jgi:hypothetical protein
MTGTDDDISEEARLLAERVRIRAAAMPAEGDLAAITAAALRSPGGQMSPAQIRALAAEALAKARQVSSLLGQLAEMLESPPGDI